MTVVELEAQLTGKAARGRARHVARYRQLEKLFWWSAAGPGRPTPDVAAAPALLATAKNNRTVHSWVNDVEFLSCTRDHMPFVLASFAASNLRPPRACTASGSGLFHKFHNLMYDKNTSLYGTTYISTNCTYILHGYFFCRYLELMWSVTSPSVGRSVSAYVWSSGNLCQFCNTLFTCLSIWTRHSLWWMMMRRSSRIIQNERLKENKGNWITRHHLNIL